jgi:hypothetical protein
MAADRDDPIDSGAELEALGKASYGDVLTGPSGTKWEKPIWRATALLETQLGALQGAFVGQLVQAHPEDDVTQIATYRWSGGAWAQLTGEGGSGVSASGTPNTVLGYDADGVLALHPFATGSVPVYDATSYGSGVGGASGNHAAAIQAAVDAAGAAGGGIVMLPKPSTHYRIGTTINVPYDNVWIVGGVLKTRCTWTGTVTTGGPMFNVTGEGVHFFNLWLQPTRCIEGIRFATGADYSAMYWCTINTFGSDGGIAVRLSSGSLRVHYCRVSVYQVGGFLVDDAGASLSMADTIFIGDSSPSIYGIRVQRGSAYVKGVPLGGGYNAVDVVIDQADRPCVFEGINVELSERLMTIAATNTMPITLRSWRADMNTACADDGRAIVDQGTGPVRIEGCTISAQHVAPRYYTDVEDKIVIASGNAWSKSEYTIRNEGGATSTTSTGRIIHLEGKVVIRTEWPNPLAGTLSIETSADGSTGWAEFPGSAATWTQPDGTNGGVYQHEFTGLTPGHYFRIVWTYSSGAGALEIIDRTIWFLAYRTAITGSTTAHGCYEWPTANKPLSPVEDGNYYQNIGFDYRIWVPQRIALTGLGIHDDGVSSYNAFASGLTGTTGVATVTATFSHTTETSTSYRVVGVAFERVSGTLPAGLSGVVTAKAQGNVTVTVDPVPNGTWQARCNVLIALYTP